VAVLFESRAHPLIAPVVLNFMANLPPNWTFQLFHSIQNQDHILKSDLKPYIDKGRVILDNTIIGNQSLSDLAVYEHIITRESTWQKVVGEKVLLFQLDSISCGNFSGDFEKFLKYDYILAPGSEFIHWAFPYRYISSGGLSLRSKSKMIEIIRWKNWFPFMEGTPNEHTYFVEGMKHFNYSIAPADIAGQFSVESKYSNSPFGVHKPWLYQYWLINGLQYKSLLDYCPEISIVSP